MANSVATAAPAGGTAHLVESLAAAGGTLHVNNEEIRMSRHNEMPPVPPANRSPRETGSIPEVKKRVLKNTIEINTAEQGDTANVRQNTTNAGYFKGRRMM
jgi:hypothetical protein